MRKVIHLFVSSQSCSGKQRLHSKLGYPRNSVALETLCVKTLKRVNRKMVLLKKKRVFTGKALGCVGQKIIAGFGGGI